MQMQEKGRNQKACAHRIRDTILAHHILSPLYLSFFVCEIPLIEKSIFILVFGGWLWYPMVSMHYFIFCVEVVNRTTVVADQVLLSLYLRTVEMARFFVVNIFGTGVCIFLDLF